MVAVWHRGIGLECGEKGRNNTIDETGNCTTIGNIRWLEAQKRNKSTLFKMLMHHPYPGGRPAKLLKILCTFWLGYTVPCFFGVRVLRQSFCGQHKIQARSLPGGWLINGVAACESKIVKDKSQEPALLSGLVSADIKIKQPTITTGVSRYLLSHRKCLQT